MRKHVIVAFVMFTSICNLFAAVDADVRIMRHLDRTAIEQHKKTIEAELRTIAYKKWAMVAASCSLATCVAYTWLKQPVTPAIVAQTPVVNAVVTPTEIMNEQISAQLREIKNSMALRPVQPTTAVGWIKHFGKSCIDQGGVLVLANIIAGSFGPLMKYFDLADEKMSEFFGSYFFKADLPWFIKHRADAKTVFDDVCRYAALADGDYAVAQQYAIRSSYGQELRHGASLEVPVCATEFGACKAYYATAVIQSWNLMGKQLEAMLGFMSMRAEAAVLERHQERINHMLVHITQRYAFYAAIVASACDSSSAQLYPLVRAWRSELEEELLSFVQLERVHLS